MSVRPVLFHESGDIDVYYDEQGHSGTIPAAEVKWSTNIDGSHSHSFIVLLCPDGCGATSTHPVGGGAAPQDVQQMFVNKTAREGCACGTVPASTNATPEAHVHLNVERMDGPTRWQYEAEGPQPHTNGVQPLAGPGETMFQVVYRSSDGLVLGTHPKGGVGQGNRVAVIHDMAEYEILLRTDPAYLSADGDHIVSTPRGS